MRTLLTALLAAMTSLALSAALVLRPGKMRDISARSQHPQWLYNLIVTGREALLGWQTAGLPEPEGT